MTLVVFLRGVNVGGHRRFRPSSLARALSDYDVVNVGATGTFVVRKPGSKARFRTVLRGKLPFEAEVAICDASDILLLAEENPFGSTPSRPDLVRFVSILAKAGRAPPALPVTIPAEGEWFVRVIGAKGQFVFGEYRLHMKTIGCLGQLDKLFGAPATTRSWSTIGSIVKILSGGR